MHVGMARVSNLVVVSCVAYFLLCFSTAVQAAASAFEPPHTSIKETPAFSASVFAGSTTSFVFPAEISAIVSSEASFFPPESVVGFIGATPTGDEPLLVATAAAAPLLSDDFPLVISPPQGSPAGSFDIFSSWGNMSPQKSVPSTDLPGASEIIPDGCTLNQVHILTRHASRYPTAGSDPAQFAAKVQNAVANGMGFTAKGPLEFLNTWTYKLGAEILGPHGRLQMYRLGVKHALEYGHLLEGFNRPLVTRTTSEDRMFESGLTYRQGFFGIPFDDLSSMSIIIESSGFNNTLAPSAVCPNFNNNIGGLSGNSTTNWVEIYLKDAVARISPMVDGLNLTAADLFAMQELCSYETINLGFSSFCSLFTVEEWEGFSYEVDLGFYYDNAFGSPVASAIGLGYLQEVLSRLTQEPIISSNSSVNATLDANPITFPLDQPIYVDHTHDNILASVVTALNFTSLNSPAPIPLDHIPPNRAFNTFHISPYAAQLVGQVMMCPDSKTSPKSSSSTSFIRWILNDAVMPQTGMGDCPFDANGLCPLDTYIAALRKRNQEIDFNFSCNAVFNATIGEITNGSPPFM